MSISRGGPQRPAQRAVIYIPHRPHPPTPPTELLRLPGAATLVKLEALPTEHGTRSPTEQSLGPRARRKQIPTQVPKSDPGLCMVMPRQYGHGSSTSGPHGALARGRKGGRGCTAPDSCFQGPLEDLTKSFHTGPGVARCRGRVLGYLLGREKERKGSSGQITVWLSGVTRARGLRSRGSTGLRGGRRPGGAEAVSPARGREPRGLCGEREALTSATPAPL